MDVSMKLRLENRVYNIAARCIEGYAGGVWSFLSHGAWIPKGKETHNISNCNNYFEGTLDSLTAGLAFSTMAANHECWIAHDNGDMRTAREWDDVYLSNLKYAEDHLNDEQLGKMFAFLD